MELLEGLSDPGGPLFGSDGVGILFIRPGRGYPVHRWTGERREGDEGEAGEKRRGPSTGLISIPGLVL